jgi:hypothetical protein
MMPMRGIFAPCCARAASGHATAPPSSVMNSRRLNWSNCIRSPPARAELQDIELSANSQRVSERLCNLLAVGENGHSHGLPTGVMVTFMMRGRPQR